jgi:hypothetical protein
LDKKQLASVVAATLGHGDNRVSPSAAILESFRGLARVGDLQGIAVACRLYLTTHPEARQYVTGHLPGVLLHDYAPLAETAETKKSNLFLDWQARNKDWEARISEHATSDDLPTIVASIVASLTAFAEAAKGS